MERPFDVPDHGLVCDMLWSDPDEVVFLLFNTGFPRTLENMKMLIFFFPCMEKSWNLKNNEISWKIMEFLFSFSVGTLLIKLERLNE